MMLTTNEDSKRSKPSEGETKGSLSTETRNTEAGTLLRSNCSVCKQCWIYINGPLRGKCIYDGPFSGYEKEKEK